MLFPYGLKPALPGLANQEPVIPPNHSQSGILYGKPTLLVILDGFQMYTNLPYKGLVYLQIAS